MPDPNTPTKPPPTDDNGPLIAHCRQLLTSENGRRALAQRDIAAVYRRLTEALAGLSS
jgi:hypothetical protein